MLVTVGDAAREIEELGEVPSNVHVETWVTHDDVARRADVIVCHGGFGSTLGALAHGTPLVVLPLFSSDQWANGDAVARTGAGITIADDRGARNVLDLPGAETIRELAGAVQLGLGRCRPTGARPLASPTPCAPYRRSTSRCSCWKKSLPRTGTRHDAMCARTHARGV